MSTSMNESGDKASLNTLQLSDIDKLAEDLLREIDRELGSQSRSASLSKDEDTMSNGVVSSPDPIHIGSNTSINDEINELSISVSHDTVEMTAAVEKTTKSHPTPSGNSDQNQNLPDNGADSEKRGQQVITESTHQSLANKDGPLQYEQKTSPTLPGSATGLNPNPSEKQTDIEIDDQNANNVQRKTAKKSVSPSNDRTSPTVLSSSSRSKKKDNALPTIVSSDIGSNPNPSEKQAYTEIDDPNANDVQRKTAKKSVSPSNGRTPPPVLSSISRSKKKDSALPTIVSSDFGSNPNPSEKQAYTEIVDQNANDVQRKTAKKSVSPSNGRTSPPVLSSSSRSKKKDSALPTIVSSDFGSNPHTSEKQTDIEIDDPNANNVQRKTAKKSVSPSNDRTSPTVLSSSSRSKKKDNALPTIVSSDIGSNPNPSEKQAYTEIDDPNANDVQRKTAKKSVSSSNGRTPPTVLSSSSRPKKKDSALPTIVSIENTPRNEKVVELKGELQKAFRDIPPTTTSSLDSTFQDEPSYSFHDGNKPHTDEASTTPTIPMSISVPQLTVLDELHEIAKFGSPRSGGTLKSTTKDVSSTKISNKEEPQSNKDQTPGKIPRSVSIPKLDLLEELDKIARLGPPVTGAFYESAYEDRRPSNVTNDDTETKPNLLEELDKVAVLCPPVTDPNVDSAYEENSIPIISNETPVLKTHVEALPNGLSYSEYRDMRDAPRRRPPIQKLQWYHYDKLDWNSLHGISGVFFIVFVSAELLQFLLTRQPSTPLRLINFFLAASLYLGGVFSKKMLKSPLGLLMNRLGAWNVAYVSLGMSFFTLPGDQWLSGEVHLINVIGSLIFPVALLDSLTVLRSELKSHRIFLRGFLVENAVVYSHLLGVPLLRIWLGYDRVVELYTTYPISECIYAVSLFSALVVSSVSFHVCRVSAGKLKIEAHYTIISLFWGWVHLPGCAVLVGFLTSYVGGIRFYARSLFVFFVASVIEKLLENSDRLRYKSLEKEQRRPKKKAS